MMPKLTRHPAALALALAAILTAPGGTAAADSELRAANELNVLIHEAAAAVCMINAGLAVGTETQALANAQGAINAHIAALQASSDSRALENLRAHWVPVDVAASMIRVGDEPTAHAAIVRENMVALERAAVLLLDQLGNESSPTEGMMLSDVVAVGLAERQEVFIHKIKYMACEMGSSDVTEAALSEFTKTLGLYEASLSALRSGVPELGINPPTNYAVNQMLAAAYYDWHAIKPLLATIATTGSASDAQLISLRGRSDVLEARMGALVTAYMTPDVTASPDAAVAYLEPANN